MEVAAGRPPHVPGRPRRLAGAGARVRDRRWWSSRSSARWSCSRRGRGAASAARAGSAGPAVSFSELATPLANTTIISVVAAVVTVALVLPIAYLTMRHRSRVSGTLDSFVVAGFALPGLVIALSLVFWVLSSSILRPLYQTYALLVFAYAVHFGAQAVRGSQVAVSGVPRRVEDAARALGAGRVRRFRTVELPLMRPGARGGSRPRAAVVHEGAAGHPAARADRLRDARHPHLERSRERVPRGRRGSRRCCSSRLSAVLTWFLTIRRMGRLDA